LPSGLTEAALLGAFSTTTTDSKGTGSGSIAFTFSAANHNFDFLPANETLTVVYDVTVTDSSGVSSSQPVTITIHGANDAAVIGDPTVAEVTEDLGVVNGNLTASGTISITDTDQNQAAFQTIVTAAQGNLGSLTLQSDGSYIYTVADSAVQYLGANDSKVDTFTVTALDGTSKQISFTIHGTDDAPVVNVTATGSSYTAGGPAVTVLSAATVSDVDNTTLTSATVTITDFVAGDVLSFTNTDSTTFGNITASYDPTTGVLTLTSAGATATLAQWQAALDTVQYSSTSSNPTNSGTDISRTITWVVNDGSLASATQTTTLNVANVVTYSTDTNLNGKDVQADVIIIESGVTLSGWGTITANVIENDGTITAQSSHTLTIISGSITGTGILEITNNTTLELDGPVGSGQTVLFDVSQGATGRLVLADPAEFNAEIKGLNPNDQIDLTNINSTTAHVQSISYDSSTNITTLVITDGTNTDTLKLVGDYSGSTWTFSNDGSGGTIMVDPPASTSTTDATVIPVAETASTLTTTDTAGSQTDVSPATVDDSTAVALNTTISNPDGDATTNVTVNGTTAVAQTTGIVSGSGSLMVNPGAALQFNSISHRVARLLTDNGAVEVINPPTLARMALSRGPGTLTIFEGQTAIITLIIVVEYLAENFKLANDAHADELLADSPASSDLTLASLSETSKVAAADKADTHATQVMGDEGTHVGADATLPADPVRADHGGGTHTVATDTIPVAYLEATGLGHEPSKGHFPTFTTTDSVEGRTAAKPVPAVSLHASSGETGSDGREATASLSSSGSSNVASMDARASAAAPVHSTAAEHSWTVDSAGAAVAPGDSASLQGAAPEYGNDQPQLANADPGTLQSLESPSQTAAPAAVEIPLATAAVEMPLATSVDDANAGAAAPVQSDAVEQPSTIAIASDAVGQSDAASLEGAASEHGNDQPHAAAHAATEIPLASAVEDANAGAAAHAHGAAAEHGAASDSAGAAVGHGEPRDLKVRPPSTRMTSRMRLGKFRWPRPSMTPMQAPRPMLTAPRRSTGRRAIAPARRSGMAIPRARKVRAPSMGMTSRIFPRMRLRKFRQPQQSATPMQAARPALTVPRRNMGQRAIAPVRRSGMAIPRARKVRAPSTGMVSRIFPDMRLRTFRWPRRSTTPMQALRPQFTVPPQNTGRRAIVPARRSGMAIPRACQLRPPSTGMISRMFPRSRLRTLRWPS
jgi:VCBS repeat-containing protein